MSFFGPATVPILVAAVSTIIVLAAGGLLTEIGPWYQNLRKPSWQPPNWLFAPAWTLIGVLSTAAAVLAWRAAQGPSEQAEVIGLFTANGLLNIGWSLLFFKLRRPDWAFAEVFGLFLSVVVLIAALAPLSATAAWLLAPYAVWVAFAGVLNRVIVLLNQPFAAPGRLVRPG